MKHPVYEDMPGAVDPDGHINWQVSSGLTTSFNKYYGARVDWWTQVADNLDLPGRGNSSDRFTISARMIHPFGYRPCRLCGIPHNVGYFYLNSRGAANLNSAGIAIGFDRADSVSKLLDLRVPEAELEGIIRELFPERSRFFDEYGSTPIAFERANYLRSPWLSPGFMGNPPDRLDGFHDYCLDCRQKNDPGRSVENLRSYQHDRRAFELWAEGDWALADSVFNAAGPGICSEPTCGIVLAKVSPDHVGPLACGFKQIPLFVPLCLNHNSSKNRRMRLVDVERLLAYEQQSGESVASRQVRGLWDCAKHRTVTDAAAKELSDLMRALEDCYLRCLYELCRSGHAGLLSTLLSPEFAYNDYEIVDLDPATLQFRSYKVAGHHQTPLRRSLAQRTVRIAFEKLTTSVEQKRRQDRKLRNVFSGAACDETTRQILRFADALPRGEVEEAWAESLAHETGTDVEQSIGGLLEKGIPSSASNPFRQYLEERFYHLGASAPLGDKFSSSS